MAGDDEEITNLTIDQVFVFKVPPRTAAAGHKCVRQQRREGRGEEAVAGSGRHCERQPLARARGGPRRHERVPWSERVGTRRPRGPEKPWAGPRAREAGRRGHASKRGKRALPRAPSRACAPGERARTTVLVACPISCVLRRAEDWKEQIWAGKLKVVTRGDDCAVKLINSETGKIFAIAPVRFGGPPAIEKGSLSGSV